jgi:RNA polymerase sigma factor (sigma-70 family)
MGTSAAESNGGPPHTEALYREHAAAVERLCRSLLRDPAEAEDATQQVFLSAHRALLNGTTPREPLAWLLAVARNECFARFRQRAALPLPAGEAPDGAAVDAAVHALRAGELARVWEEVERMPAAQRDVFLLREIRGLSYGQLGDQLSLSPPSVRSLLLRARLRLRNRLRDVAAVLGGAPWVKALVRLAAGGDGPSPLPAATKAAAVGLGALALAGSGALPHATHHAPRTAPHPAAARHRAEAHVRHVASPAAVTAPLREERSGRGEISAEPVGRHDDRSRGGSDDRGGATPMTGPIAEPTTSGGGHDGSGSSDSVTGTTTTTATTTASNSGEGSSTSGSGSGSDDGSAVITTTTTSSGSDSGSDSGSTSDTLDGHTGGGS